MGHPTTLTRSVSPPATRRASPAKHPSVQAAHDPHDEYDNSTQKPGPPLAAIEAGQVEIRDHLEYFATHFAKVIRWTIEPRLGLDEFKALYLRNQHRHGCHFVLHQHDHPISGVHYDLRLQFSESSTLSFAIPYGLPGNPNSVKPNRMAIETRVHNLWNNLIESASHATGSLLIWDTGEYEILPWKIAIQQSTDDELSGDEGQTTATTNTHSDRLRTSFQGRHMRLRLHGARLPRDYTVSLRLPSGNDRCRPPKLPSRKRRRIDPATITKKPERTTDSESDADLDDVSGDTNDENAAGNASEDDFGDDEDDAIRFNNAYTGASNTIGSVHQRHWFLTLDRANSGFYKARSGPNEGRWVGDWSPFFVRGRDHERSVLTGRTADEVLEDEGVDKFVGRKMWRPIME